MELIITLRAEFDARVGELEAAADCVRWHHDDQLDYAAQYPEHAALRISRDDLQAWIDSTLPRVAALIADLEENRDLHDDQQGELLLELRELRKDVTAYQFPA